MPPAWNSSATANMPTSCSPSPVAGTYKPATNTAWPEQSCSTPPSSISVRFNAHVTTSPGETVYLVGSTPELGSWDPNAGVKLHADAYSAAVPLWYGTVELASGTALEFKTVKTGGGNGAVWEPGQNQSFTVPEDCGVFNATVNSYWN